MENEFIPYEQALALKELGFEEDCLSFYDPHNKNLYIVGNPLNYNFISTLPEILKVKNPKARDISAPLYQQAFRWLVNKITNPLYVEDFLIAYLNEYRNKQEAELECLKELIKIIKSK